MYNKTTRNTVYYLTTIGYKYTNMQLLYMMQQWSNIINK